MKPYYQDDYITIIHGNCEAILPGLVGICSIVTDPPYGVDVVQQNRVGNSKVVNFGFYEPVYGDDKPFDPTKLLDYQNVILWGANYYTNKLPVTSSWLIWDKREGGNSDNYADAEMAWTNLGGPARLFRHLWRGMIRASEKDSHRIHPTQKPVALMAWCIQQIKQPGLICDPYTGSGSTLVAAKQLGLKAIGIEIVESYCEVTADRVSKTGVMFSTTPLVVMPEPEQLELLSLQEAA